MEHKGKHTMIEDQLREINGSLQQLVRLFIAYQETKTEPSIASVTEPKIKRERKNKIIPDAIISGVDTSKKEVKEPLLNKPSLEEAVEIQRQCTDVIAMFIKKHLNDEPLSGYQQVRQIIQAELGHPIDKLADLKYEDHLILIPRFRQELGI
jgi:hypothetical protein